MNSRDINLWLDERWYNALSCQLKKKDTTVEDELNTCLDAMIGQLPEQARERISRVIREEDQRQLYAHMERFDGRDALDAHIVLTHEPEESMVICTPFDKPGHFYFNQKINCLRASGKVTVGEQEYMLDPSDTFAVLDWGRGVWTYHNTWYWASASGLVEGVPFGFNLGYGFGNTSAATENMLFYNGKAHKLSKVRFRIPGRRRKRRYMEQWEFTSDDGRFEMRFDPVMDRSACTGVGVIKSDQHQIFGRFTGLALLDDGTEVFVKDFMGFAEEVENKW